MKEIDLGYTYDDGPCCEAPTTKEKKISYPTLHIGHMSKDDGMKIGTEFYAKVKLCKVGARKAYDGNGFDCEYDVKSLEPISEKEDKDFGEMLEALEE